MDDSRFFIAVLSPVAAASPWVDRELSYWLARRGTDQVLFVLVAGQVAWNESLQSFDPARSDAAPPSLTAPGVLRHEPLYVDLAWATQAGDVDPGSPRFRSAVLDLAAPIHGRPKDELRERRPAGAAALPALQAHRGHGIGDVARGCLGRGRRGVGPTERSHSSARRGSSPGARRTSRDSSRRRRSAPPIRTQGWRWRWKPKAVRRRRSSKHADAYVRSLQRLSRLAATQELPALHHSGGVGAVAWAPDGMRIATGGADGGLLLWDAVTGSEVAAPETAHSGEIIDIAWSADGQRLATAANDGSVEMWSSDEG